MGKLVSRPSRTEVPPLYNGDRLTQEEFHRRYEAYPEDVKIELIGGVVYMASPARISHGTHHIQLGFVLVHYQMSTPGVHAADNITTILGEESEPQPDLLLRLLPEYGGLARANEKNYLVGPPELVAEIAHSSVAIDMNRKHRDYLAAGVQEYVVFCVEEQQLHWFHFPSRKKLKADKNGLWKSRAFPGLWIDGPALVAQDIGRLSAAVQQGIASPEHAAFVARLARQRGQGTAKR